MPIASKPTLAAPLSLALALALLVLGAPAARAAYGPGGDAVSSVGTRLGSLDSRSPSVSGDGRYVVFVTSAPELLGSPADPATRYVRGLVRRDLLTGAVELVAPPLTRRADGSTVFDGASSPPATISGDGRYVVFQSASPLVPGDLNTSPDVYVRDMTRPVADDGAYTLVSALDGTDDAPSYAAGGSRPGQQGFGLSDDGRTAVFWTTGPSNLPAGGDPSATPTNEVFVRHLDDRRTELVSRSAATGAPAPRPTGPRALPSADPVISGDGTAVAWTDPEVGAQIPLLPGEPSPLAAYLWRRIGDGPAAVTRRVAGASDLDDPACAPTTPFQADDQGDVGPCGGPFINGGEAGATDQANAAPLSITDDGRTLAFASLARVRPYDPVNGGVGQALFVADMSPGLSRKRSVRRVLRVPGSPLSNGGGIDEAVIAGDGRRIVLRSQQVTFEGARRVGDVVTDTSSPCVYVLDLGAGTIQRATTAADGTDYHGAVVDPTTPNVFADTGLGELAADDDAGVIAFQAGDGNLFVGDANGVSDVQVVRGSTAVAGTGGEASAPLAGALAVAGQSLAPIAAPRPVHPVIGYPTLAADGTARIVVRVPAAGRLTASATARVRGRRLTVATTRRTATRAATLTLRLTPRRAARSARRRARLRVAATIGYRPRAGASTSVTRTYTLSRRRP